MKKFKTKAISLLLAAVATIAIMGSSVSAYISTNYLWSNWFAEASQRHTPNSNYTYLIQNVVSNTPGCPTLSIDGSFGQNTHNGVVSFQARRSLTPDGIVGRNTWQSMQLRQYISRETTENNARIDYYKLKLKTVTGDYDNPGNRLTGEKTRHSTWGTWFYVFNNGSWGQIR